jgi:hypothetical protein
VRAPAGAPVDDIDLEELVRAVERSETIPT